MLNKMAVYKYEAKFIAKPTQNIKRGLQMGLIREKELHEYKSHVDKGLELFISVKRLILVTVNTRARALSCSAQLIVTKAF